MATLSLTLMGDVACRLEERPVRFARRSGLALAVYLAHTGRAQSRAALAALFAAESDEPSALTPLQNALRDLRAALGDLVRVDRRTVALASTVTLITDAGLFEAAAQAALESGAPAAIREALAHYKGEFAAGFAVKGAPGFDEWLLHERERLRALYLYLLEQLALAEERAGDRTLAIATTRRLLAVEPWREEAHCRLMRLLAADGQRAAALLQYEQCLTALQRELGVEPQPETVALYRRLQGEPVTPPHNLPARATTFIDRPAERALIAEQLQRPGRRLITLVGIGGAGKTRLALELAAQFTRPGLPDALAFPDGVFLVTCGEAERSESTSAQPLTLALLRALNLTVTPGAKPDELLLRWLAPRTALLIFDNAETEPTVAAFARALLAAAPHVRLLITSRVRLHLDAEWAFGVGSLVLPTSVDDLPRSEAGQLFLERARAVRLRYPPGPDDYPHIVRICRLVHGLPLALVLAAGRRRALSCAAIADQLERDLGLLVSEAPDLPARQRDLTSVLRWSYAQLTAEEARCLRTLAVFPGEFNLEAACAVCGCTPAVLEALIDSGLLTRNSGRSHSLHPLVRQIAAEELAAHAGEGERAAQGHADYFAALAASVVERLEGDAGALVELIVRWSDLRQAWGWAVARRSLAQLSRLRPGMSQMWYGLGVFQEGVGQCEQAVASLLAASTPHPEDPAVSGEIVELLLIAAWLHIHDDRATQALVAIDRARAFAASGDAALRPRIDQLEGTRLYLHARYRAARPPLERALAAAAASGNRGAERALLSVLARLAYRQGDPRVMRATVAAVKQRFDEDEPGLDMVLLRYAQAHLAADQGQLAPARGLLAQREMPPDAAEHFQLRFWHWSLEMTVAMAEGRLGDAEALMWRVEQQAAVMGSGFIASYTAVMLGDTLVAQGGCEDAEPHFVRAYQQAQTSSVRRQQCCALLGLARCAEQRGELARARDLAVEGLQIARGEAYLRLEREALMLVGWALAGLGRHSEAAETFTLARKAGKTFGSRAYVAEAAVALAAALLAQGDRAGALRILEPQLPLLLDSALTAMSEPLRALACAVATMRAAGDARALSLEERARCELARRAELVRAERRASFLQVAPDQRALQALTASC